MATESIAMPSVTSTLTQHGGLKAAMPVSPSVSGGDDVGEQQGVESTAQASQVPPAHIRAAEPRIDKADIEKQAQELLERLDNLSKVKEWTINFSLIPDVDQPVIKVIDAKTKEVIRQIPSEEMLLISKRLQSMEQSGNTISSLSGLLFDGQV